MKTSVSLDKTIAVSCPIQRQGGWIRQETQRVANLVQCTSLSLWTRASETLFAEGDPNKVADSYFLPRCGNLIDNQSGLNG